MGETSRGTRTDREGREKGAHAPTNENWFWNITDGAEEKHFAQIRELREQSFCNFSVATIPKSLVGTVITRYRIYCQGSKWCTRALIAKFTNYIYRQTGSALRIESIGMSGCEAKNATPRDPD